MRAAILCPGPSLKTVEGRKSKVEGTDYVIAVNRAVLWGPCDYWSCPDVHTFAWLVKAGGVSWQPTLVCLRQIHRVMLERYRAETERYGFFARGQINFEAPNLQWQRFGAHVAIAMACHLGASTIDCYGMDLAGTEDADGFAHPLQRREPERWELERRLFGELVELLDGRGIELRRVGVDSERTQEVTG